MPICVRQGHDRVRPAFLELQSDCSFLDAGRGGVDIVSEGHGLACRDLVLEPGLQFSNGDGRRDSAGEADRPIRAYRDDAAVPGIGPPVDRHGLPLSEGDARLPVRIYADGQLGRACRALDLGLPVDLRLPSDRDRDSPLAIVRSGHGYLFAVAYVLDRDVSVPDADLLTVVELDRALDHLVRSIRSARYLHHGVVDGRLVLSTADLDLPSGARDEDSVRSAARRVCRDGYAVSAGSNRVGYLLAALPVDGHAIADDGGSARYGYISIIADLEDRSGRSGRVGLLPVDEGAVRSSHSHFRDIAGAGLLHAHVSCVGFGDRDLLGAIIVSQGYCDVRGRASGDRGLVPCVRKGPGAPALDREARRALSCLVDHVAYRDRLALRQPVDGACVGIDRVRLARRHLDFDDLGPDLDLDSGLAHDLPFPCNEDEVAVGPDLHLRVVRTCICALRHALNGRAVALCDLGARWDRRRVRDTGIASFDQRELAACGPGEGDIVRRHGSRRVGPQLPVGRIDGVLRRAREGHVRPAVSVGEHRRGHLPYRRAFPSDELDRAVRVDKDLRVRADYAYRITVVFRCDCSTVGSG